MNKTCPRCGSRVELLLEPRDELDPVTEVILLVVGGMVFRAILSVLIAALVSLGFVHSFAWVLALALLTAFLFLAHWGTKKRRRRFLCRECGVDFPNDMVKSA